VKIQSISMAILKAACIRFLLCPRERPRQQVRTEALAGIKDTGAGLGTNLHSQEPRAPCKLRYLQTKKSRH